MYKSIQQGTIQTNNQKGPILTREQYNIHKQEGTVYNPNSEGNIAKFTMMRNSTIPTIRREHHKIQIQKGSLQTPNYEEIV